MATEEKDKKNGDEKDTKNRRIVRDRASGKSFYVGENDELTEIDPEMDRLSDVLASKVCDEMERRQLYGASDGASDDRKKKTAGSSGGGKKTLAEKLGIDNKK
jgi:hypothetical protein